MEIDTLLYANWIIPVEPVGQVLQDHAIAIKDGRIVEILPGATAEQRYTARDSHRYPEHVLIPGFINAHTHAAMTLLRGIADDLPLMEWLNQHIWPAEQKFVSSEFVRDGVRHAIAEMIRGGTTCFNDMYFFPDQTALTASSAGIRACVGLIVIDFPSAWANGPDEYFSKGEMVHDQFRHDPLIVTAFAPHAPYSVSDEALKRVSTMAEELDIPIHIHVHETADEVNNAFQETGERPLQRLERLGLLSPRLQAVHMTQLRPEEIDKVRRFGVHVVHCPESNLKLASGFCPLSRLNEAGINIAIGTDGAASNNDLDMLGEMRSAALLAKAVCNDASAIPAADVLEMATLNGAKALGIDEITGSLRPGKAADIVAVRLTDVETQPLYSPLSQIVYAAGRDKVTDVWVAGRQLLRERKLLTLNESEILEQTYRWRDRVSGLGHHGER